MSEFSTLTIKIPLELKEAIRASASEKQLSLSAEVCERLANSLNRSDDDTEKPAPKKSKKVQPDVDSQHTEEVAEQPLSQKELKRLRQLLKNSGKKR